MADAKVIITAEDRTRAAFRSAQSGLMSLGRSVAAIAGVAGFGALIKSQLDAGDALAKTSQKIGVSVEKLSAYQYAAKLSGISNEQLATSLSRLAANMQDAAINKSGEAAQYFKGLGISVVDAGGKMRGTEAVFEQLGVRFGASADGAGKTATAIKLMGRSGTDLIPLLNNLGGLTDEAERTGAVFSTKFAKSAEQFNDDLQRAQQNTLNLTRALVGELLPGINKVMEAMLRLMSGGALFKHDQRAILQTQIDALMRVYEDALARGDNLIAENYRSQIDNLIRQMQTENTRAKAAIESGPKISPAALIGDKTIQQKRRNPFEDLLESWRDTTMQMQQASARWAQASADALTDFVMTGKLKFSDFANSIIRDLIRIRIQQNLVGLFGGFSFGGGGSTSAVAGTGIMEGLPSYDVGTPYVPRDQVALVHRGEAIIPAAENRAGGSGGVIVNVINQTSAPVNATSNGGRQIGKDFVVNVVLQAIDNYGPLRTAIAGVR